jgi:hypothetical protein
MKKMMNSVLLSKKEKYDVKDILLRTSKRKSNK